MSEADESFSLATDHLATSHLPAKKNKYVPVYVDMTRCYTIG